MGSARPRALACALLNIFLDNCRGFGHYHRISLDQGTSTGDGRLMRAGAVPGMGARNLVLRRFGNSPGRPRRRSARSWLPGGADRLSATMKRGTGLSHKSLTGLWQSRGRAPEGELPLPFPARVSGRVRVKGSAARTIKQAATLVWRPRGIYPRALRRSASLFCAHRAKGKEAKNKTLLRRDRRCCLTVWIVPAAAKLRRRAMNAAALLTAEHARPYSACHI
jgi:hypothetical protein